MLVQTVQKFVEILQFWTRILVCRWCTCARWTLAGSPRGVLPSVSESDGSAPCCGMSGCPSLWPWPRSCNTPQEDRGWPSRGGGSQRCTSRPHSGRILLPQAAGTLYFPMDVNDLPVAGGSRLTEVRPQERVQRHTVEQIILAPMLDVPVPLMEEQLLVDAFHRMISRSPSKLSKCTRSSSTSSQCELLFASRSWRNSWWKCRRSSPIPRCSGLWSRTWTFQFRVV